MKLPYYKQQAMYTCGLACLRMILESLGKKYSEYELATAINFDYGRGVPISLLVDICNSLGVKYYLNTESSLEQLLNFLNGGYYPIVLVNPGLLYFTSMSEYAYFIVIKNLTDKYVIFNDPDQEFGGENKIIDTKKFLEAWKSKYNLRWVLILLKVK